MVQSGGGRRFRCPCGFGQIRVIVYIVGLVISLWQTAVCLDKYLQFFRSTQVSLNENDDDDDNNPLRSQ